MVRPVKRRERPESVTFAIDLEPRSRTAALREGARCVLDGSDPVRSLLLSQWPVVAIVPFAPGMASPPLLVQDADRRAVRGDGVRMDDLQPTSAVRRRPNGVEVLLPARVGQSKDRAIDDDVYPALSAALINCGCLDRGEHRVAAHVLVAE